MSRLNCGHPQAAWAFEDEETGEGGCIICLLCKATEEMLSAAAACFRVIDKAGLEDILGVELKLAGVRNGFGKRAAEALRKAKP